MQLPPPHTLPFNPPDEILCYGVHKNCPRLLKLVWKPTGVAWMKPQLIPLRSRTATVILTEKDCQTPASSSKITSRWIFLLFYWWLTFHLLLEERGFFVSPHMDAAICAHRSAQMDKKVKDIFAFCEKRKEKISQTPRPESMEDVCDQQLAPV